MSEEVRRLAGVDTPLGGARSGAFPGFWMAVGRAIHSRHRAALTAIGLLLLLVGWEIGSRIAGDPVILPSPYDTVADFLWYLWHPYPTLGFMLWQHALFSTERILLGFGIGVVVGIGFGALMISVRPVRNLFDPLIELTRPLPPLAFIPIFIVWFGIGDLPKVVLITVGVIPIMIVSTVSSLDRVPQEMLNAARCLGASPGYSLLHVRIRCAVPAIITGMRIAMGGAWTSIVAAEMIVATNGLGYVTQQAGLYLDTKLIFAGILAIAILGITFDTILRRLQRALDPSGQSLSA
ncbi:MAG: binding-protein-dependent transport system inner rane component [Chloroflexi bacterium]|nr:binding-protein-dependent transport system inner rane component [Chloroflexota bacterium]